MSGQLGIGDWLMEAMEWVMRPPGHLRLAWLPALVMSAVAMAVVTPGAWLFGTAVEKVVWTVLPLGVVGVCVSVMTSRITVDPVGVRQVSLPVARTFRWEDIEAVDVVFSGLARLPVAGLRIRGRSRPVKLWQTGRMSAAGMRERDAFIAELRRRFELTRGPA